MHFNGHTANKTRKKCLECLKSLLRKKSLIAFNKAHHLPFNAFSGSKKSWIQEIAVMNSENKIEPFTGRVSLIREKQKHK